MLIVFPSNRTGQSSFYTCLQQRGASDSIFA